MSVYVLCSARGRQHARTHGTADGRWLEALDPWLDWHRTSRRISGTRRGEARHRRTDAPTHLRRLGDGRRPLARFEVRSRGEARRRLGDSDAETQHNAVARTHFFASGPRLISKIHSFTQDGNETGQLSLCPLPSLISIPPIVAVVLAKLGRSIITSCLALAEPAHGATRTPARTHGQNRVTVTFTRHLIAPLCIAQAGRPGDKPPSGVAWRGVA